MSFAIIISGGYELLGKMGNILLGSHDAIISHTMAEALGPDHTITVTSSWEELQAKIPSKSWNYCFLQIGFIPDGFFSTQEILSQKLGQFKSNLGQVPIIVLAPGELTRKAVKTVRAGLDEYLNIPLDSLEISHVLESIREQTRLTSELHYLRDEITDLTPPLSYQTRNGKMRDVFEKLKSVAPTKTTVLLQGETGTGKSVFAQSLHLNSNRKSGPFINIHCGALPDNLIESELFGHEKGSFTGASKLKIGKFELGEGGTVFLDEIGTITPSMQVKLLKVLQEKSFQRVGGEGDIQADIRIIAATNDNLQNLVDQKIFRSDLFYRLNVFPIEIPPLRERLEDIPILVDGFIKKLNEREGKNISGLADEVMEALQIYSWPGNIRELENLIERAYILEKSQFLSFSSFPSEVMGIKPGPLFSFSAQSHSLAEIRKKSVEITEKKYLQDLLEKSKGKIGAAAKIAEISPRQLHKLLSKHQIDKADFKNKRSDATTRTQSSHL